MILPNCRLMSAFWGRLRQARLSYDVWEVKCIKCISTCFQLTVDLLGRNPIESWGRAEPGAQLQALCWALDIIFHLQSNPRNSVCFTHNFQMSIPRLEEFKCLDQGHYKRGVESVFEPKFRGLQSLCLLWEKWHPWASGQSWLDGGLPDCSAALLVFRTSFQTEGLSHL